MNITEIETNIHEKRDIKFCPMEINETEDSSLCVLDLPLFITTSEQREVMNKAMIKAKIKEKSITET